MKNSAWAWGSPNTEKDTNENKPPTPNIEVLDEPKEKPKEAVEVEKDKVGMPLGVFLLVLL